MFVATPEIAFSQLFFPIKGILVVYDREEKTFRALPGADDPCLRAEQSFVEPRRKGDRVCQGEGL